MEALAQYGWPGVMIAVLALTALIFKMYHKLATDIAVRSIQAMNNFAEAVRENTNATRGLTALFQSFIKENEIRQKYEDRER